MICDDELKHAINRLCLRALSRFWVPDGSESRVHLQRLHTQGFLRVSRPVPRQASPVGQTFTAHADRVDDQSVSFFSFHHFK